MKDFSEGHCVPCEGGVPALSSEEVRENLRFVPGWSSVNDHEIVKEFVFPNFQQALTFVNRVGALAEKESHHPDIFLAWGKVKITLWTHAVDGLSVNDFVLAAKIDKV